MKVVDSSVIVVCQSLADGATFQLVFLLRDSGSPDAPSLSIKLDGAQTTFIGYLKQQVGSFIGSLRVCHFVRNELKQKEYAGIRSYETRKKGV